MQDPREYAAERSVLLFKIVEELNVACGYERSFKMLDGKLLANRFLLGINTDSVSCDRLVDVCRRLQMPDHFKKPFVTGLADANLVFLGFEDHEPGCIYKVYLEFWEKLKQDLNSAPNHMPATLHLGFKWKADEPTQASVSKYICFPKLSVSQILNRIGRIYESQSNQLAGSITEAIIRSAADRLIIPSSIESPFIYLEVVEEGCSRRSFDINLYQAGLRVGEIEFLLSKIARHYQIPAEKLVRLYRLVGDKRLGHLSGGVNNAEQDFLTVYYEA